MEKNKHFKVIEEALEEIRPYLKADGGDISLLEVSDDLVVKVKLLGACVGCPMSYQTMKNGVEQVVKKAVPEVKEVLAILE
ncbi:NifU family protein [Saccharicrinis fermentans]|uniref:Fe/S biogenesis protein nfuA n=1 Tax=Saccharicrinis fermentans DSM 9555 = JCM 21142 TaxID=869213 RepID=W7XWS8_9BACT|nr:NifU family protein [Saccharicrinis fermentans]GAF02820.1 Fe/S biogenesis protein nfuA [Saccharicrinis fermentans DSM 9555 = JCM 21142]